MPHIRDIFLGQGVPEPYRGNRTNIIDNNMFGRITPEPLSASTKKLFDAIDDENLEAFKQALADGADVNAFDAGYTPLMTIIVSNRGSPICLKMMMLLLQHQDLNVNIQEPKENNTALHLAFHMGNRNFVQMLFKHPNLNLDIKNNYNDCYGVDRSDTPKEYVERIGRGQRKDFSHLTVEIQKAQKGKQLLDALSNRNIYQAKVLLNQELNPNCWRRNQNGEIETPLSLIIKSCLEGITEDKKEVLVKLLKHKELDFSQIKPIQNKELKLLVELTIKERLTDTIKREDLDDVKELVEDNCFMSYAIIAAALRDVGNPIESITDYLNKKFPASVGRSLAGMNDMPIDFEEFVQELVDGLEKAKAQLTKKEKELSDARQELNKRNDEIGKQQNRILELERELHHAKIRLAKGDIKKSAEDNCFMGRTIVTAVLENVNEKFSASAERPLASIDSTPIGFEQGVAKLADELESVQAQLAKKEKELSDIKQELNKRNNEIREQQNKISELKRELGQAKAQLTEKGKLNNTREESRIHQIRKESDERANSPGGKQNNYALTFFILCGICAVGTCLTTVDYPEVSAGLAAVALGLFLVGYFLYKGDEKDVGPVSTTDNLQVTSNEQTKSVKP
ncbi:MAG: ankyrin repeat domain-containing protein [Wolbachia endosymbiont of Penenirmus auritus]|nr:ankyrin repeat domain-containing protein [Wolbachia endosymbiont of Penenirmus auritus]